MSYPRDEYSNFVRDMIIRPGYNSSENCEIDHVILKYFLME